MDIFKGYHLPTRHAPHRYANSLGFMDWANQPTPFRFYEGSPVHRFSLPQERPEVPYAQLFQPKGESKPLTRESLSRLLAFTAGLSTWKRDGHQQWALRMVPSSGNLHPNELYVLTANLKGIKDGLWHYCPLTHRLSLRRAGPKDSNGQTLTVLGTTIPWREAWKYGERALRYCLLDTGHLMAQLALVATSLGWMAHFHYHLGMVEPEEFLGLGQTRSVPDEREYFTFAATLEKTGSSIAPQPHYQAFLSPIQGRPNRLSHETVAWPTIEEAMATTATPAKTILGHNLPQDLPQGHFCLSTPVADRLLRNRRSAQAYLPNQSTLPYSSFIALLDRLRWLCQQDGTSLLEAMPPLQLAIFVHRVADLPSGLYWFQPSPQAVASPPFRRLQTATALTQTEMAGVTLLEQRDVTQVARRCCCHQALAADGSLALVIMGNFNGTEEDPHLYRRLHFRAGMVGQLLYLEAEAQGFRGTGIGCFFDEEIRRTLALEDSSLYPLYGFTIGVPLEDHRLTNLAPYHHLELS
jgi:SagB-type dehydrogenase family enzyme